MERILQVPELGWLGDFGNRLHIYAVARKYAEMTDAKLEVPEWPGRHIFDINDPIAEERPHFDLAWPLPRTFEGVAHLTRFRLFNYPRIYDREELRRFLPFKEAVALIAPETDVAIHVRHFNGTPSDVLRPQISERDMTLEAYRHGFRPEQLTVCSDYTPRLCASLPNGIQFALDFMLLVKTRNLFRFPCSTFSGYAAFFNQHNIYSAVNVDCVGSMKTAQWEREIDPAGLRKAEFTL